MISKFDPCLASIDSLCLSSLRIEGTGQHQQQNGSSLQGAGSAHRWGGDRWAHGSVSTLEMARRGKMLPCDYVTTIRPQKQICGAIPNTWAMWKTSCKEMIFSWCRIGHLPDSCNNGIEATRGKQLTDPWRCLAKSPLRIWLKKAGWKSHVWIVCCCSFDSWSPDPHRCSLPWANVPTMVVGNHTWKLPETRVQEVDLTESECKFLISFLQSEQPHWWKQQMLRGKKKKSGRLWKNLSAR